jgi:hypothetical protein
MIALGNYNTLPIAKRVDFGLYLDGGEAGEILLPARYVTPEMHIGDSIEVFVYLDQEERLVATTERPVATVGQFACLKCSWTNQYGAFLAWGLQMKDLFCPFREQKQRMERDKKYIVYIRIDEDSYRLMATAKVERYLSPALSPSAGSGFPAASPSSPAGDASPAATPLRHGSPVDCLVWQKTPLGFKCIVDNRYQGMLYDNQLFQPLTTGDRFTAYVDHIRQDGKIDLTIQPTGHRHTLNFAEELLRYLYENNGRCEFDDNTPAELIYDRFNVSKKVFKRAIGDLYRRKLITIGDKGIQLLTR